MNFNKFYSGLTDEQKRYVNHKMKEDMDEQKIQAAVARGFSWFVLMTLMFAITGQISSLYRR